MTWILTRHGRRFNLDCPQAADVDILDIAHSLSNTCRFAGHTKTFYSVAQHSLMVSDLVEDEHALAGLLHDAPEAYVGDATLPLKQLVPGIKAIEERVWAAIAERYCLSSVLHPSVKHADRVMLATERRDLMPDHPDAWAVLDGIEPMPWAIRPMSPDEAYLSFMGRFNELSGMAA